MERVIADSSHKFSSLQARSVFQQLVKHFFVILLNGCDKSGGSVISRVYFSTKREEQACHIEVIVAKWVQQVAIVSVSSSCVRLNVWFDASN